MDLKVRTGTETRQSRIFRLIVPPLLMDPLKHDLLSNNDVFAPPLLHVQPRGRDLQVVYRISSRRRDSAVALSVVYMIVLGTLFIAGLSECGVEFHVGTLLSVTVTKFRRCQIVGGQEQALPPHISR